MNWTYLLYYAAGVLAGIPIGMGALAQQPDQLRLKLGFWAASAFCVFLFMAIRPRSG